VIRRIARLVVIAGAIFCLAGCVPSGISFSPSGKQLVLAGADGIHIMNSDGSGVRKLPHSDGGFTPKWSPDGKWIAFARNYASVKGKPQKYGTWVCRISNLKSRILIEEFGGPFAWREDGARLAGFRAEDKNRKAQLCICDPTNGSLMQTTDLPPVTLGSPIWIPHTDSLVVQSGNNGDLYIVERNACRQITTGGHILGAGLSRDGTRLYWVRQPLVEQFRWEVIGFDLVQSKLSRMPFPSQPRVPAPRPGFHMEQIKLEIAPGAEKISFTVLYTDSPRGQPNRARRGYMISEVMGLDGSTSRVIRTGELMTKRSGEYFAATAWSQDGRKIALQVLSTKPKRTRLYIYDSAGRNGRLIYSAPSK